MGSHQSVERVLDSRLLYTAKSLSALIPSDAALRWLDEMGSTGLERLQAHIKDDYCGEVTGEELLVMAGLIERRYHDNRMHLVLDEYGDPLWHSLWGMDRIIVPHSIVPLQGCQPLSVNTDDTAQSIVDKASVPFCISLECRLPEEGFQLLDEGVASAA